MMDARETAAQVGGESDTEAVSAQAKKPWHTPKLTRLDGKHGPLNSAGGGSDGLAPSS